MAKVSFFSPIYFTPPPWREQSLRCNSLTLRVCNFAMFFFSVPFKCHAYSLRHDGMIKKVYSPSFFKKFVWLGLWALFIVYVKHLTKGAGCLLALKIWNHAAWKEEMKVIAQSRKPPPPPEPPELGGGLPDGVVGGVPIDPVYTHQANSSGETSRAAEPQEGKAEPFVEVKKQEMPPPKKEPPHPTGKRSRIDMPPADPLGPESEKDSAASFVEVNGAQSMWQSMFMDRPLDESMVFIGTEDLRT